MKRILPTIFSILSIITLIGCSAQPGGSAAEAQSPAVVKKANAGNVVAEGVVTPTRAGYLAFKLGGDVAQVWVKE
ncbi:MAG: hypothetical protein JW934_18435, partial [Anaerolineae bacterium]|nr:hypothetical protein [Anaerolineae bacterium]